jgi:conjugal transfer pilus assembly protein TraI
MLHTDTEPDPLSDVPRYPPFDRGIPVTPVERIVASQRDLITRIYRTAGISREEFAERIETAIVNLAGYVHLLPATATEFHRGAGGLFRLALEIGLHSLQAANSAVFPTGGGIERRFHMQPKWAMATLFAGLCSQLYRPINNMVVLDRRNSQWKPLLQPLHAWAMEQNADVYFLRWLDERNMDGAQASAAYLINVIVPSSTLQYLAEDNNQVVQAMTAAIAGAGMATSENPVARIVAPITTRVIEQDLKLSAMNYGHHTVGIHLEPHLIDAMRRLIKGGQWPYNTSDAVVWVGREGTFIRWAAAAPQIVNLLTRDSFAGIPRDPDTLADMLRDAQVIAVTPKGDKYWTIVVPDSGEMLEGMVRLKSRDLIFAPGFDFSQYDKHSLLLADPTANTRRAEPAGSVGRSQAAPMGVQGYAVTKADTLTSSPQNRPLPGSELSTILADVPETQPQEMGSDRGRRTAAREKPDAKSKSAEAGPAKDVARNATTSPDGRLLASLSDDAAWVMKEIVANYASGTLTGRVVTLPNGVGVSNEEISAHSRRPMQDFLNELSVKQWLWIDKVKPQRKLHPVDIDGAQYQMMIIKPAIAVGLGLAVQSS